MVVISVVEASGKEDAVQELDAIGERNRIRRFRIACESRQSSADAGFRIVRRIRSGDA